MQLGKWSSNQPSLLQDLPSDDIVGIPVGSGEIVSILGLKWCPNSDTLVFQASLIPINGAITKRMILSHIAKLFDPLGFLAPIIVFAKLLLLGFMDSRV